MTESFSLTILSLNGVVFQGVSGEVGPVNLELRPGEDRALTMDFLDDGLRLVRIIKGMERPLRGQVLKNGKDATGWIVRDGIIALTGNEEFLSTTVEEEISFAVDVGKAKGRAGLTDLLPVVLELSGFNANLKRPISGLNETERDLLALASSLLMLPDLVVLVEVFGEEGLRPCRYQDLLNHGKRVLRFSTLRIVTASASQRPVTRNEGELSLQDLQTTGGKRP